MNETEKALEKYFLELPANFQQAIKETSWKQVVNKIGLANNLSPEQLVTLETETLMVIYGIEEAESYIQNITQELLIDTIKAQVIASDITKEVFEVIENRANELEFKIKPPTPTVITSETKKSLIQELAQRVELAKQGGASIRPSALKPTEEIHPMIKPGEVAHVETPAAKPTVPNPPTPTTPIPPEPALKNPGSAPVPPLAQPNPSTPSTSPTDTKKPLTPSSPHYPEGSDPYREPLA